MTSKLITVLLTCACAGIARANFNPVALTPGSYTYDIVVESNAPAALPYCITATSGAGTSEGDYTYFEQGFLARPGQPGYNDGIPLHNTIFTNINNSSVTFLMPPTVLTNDDLQVDSSTTLTGTLNFNSPTTATNLAILAGGSSTVTLSYIATHTDGSTDTGTINFSDWFTANGVQIAWGANSRVNAGGGFDTRSTSTANTTYPYLYSYYIKVAGTLPITSLAFTYVSGGGEGNIYAVSGKAPGSSVWTPIPVGGFNQMTTVPVAFPVTATMDNGTNTSNSGTLNTFFEVGYDPADLGVGLPPSGSTFTSLSQPTHQYTMGNYSTNNAILIDASHLVENITPASPAPYSSFAFLTAGGNIDNGNTMTNICILQHADGVQETNLFYAYDWFNSTVAPAFVPNGRVSMYSRTLNDIGIGNPKLFESYFVLNDVGSPVTNIVVKFKTAPVANSTTFIMAVSASSGGVAPVISAGASPTTQTLFPTQSASFSVQESGTPPITNFWQVESNGVYVPLANGVDFNGSTVSGNGTTTLTLSDLTVNDGTNYIDVVANAFGSVTSAPAALVINTGTAVAPIIDSQIPTSAINVLTGHVDTTVFSVTIDPSSTTPLAYQWYNGSTPIAGATGATYANVDTNAANIYCVITNFGGTISSTPVAINLISKPSPTPYQAALLAYNPIAYWPLSETSGNIAFDYAGTNDGTYEGAYSLGQPGLPDTSGIGANVSVGFDGSTAYVDIPLGKLDITGPITLVQWVQTSATGFQTTLGHGDLSYRLDVSGTEPHFADDGPDVVSPISIADGNWHMLVGVYNGSEQYLYVDGVAEGSPAPSVPSGSGYDVWIGGAPDYAGGRNLLGNSAQVAIIPSALTAAQVAALYSSIGVPPVVTITPANPTVYAGGSVTLTAQTSGSAPTSYQWYYLDNSNNSNNITGATNASYTLTDAPLADNGYSFGVTVANASGSATASVVLSVQNGPTFLSTDISPLAGEAYVGAPVTYTVVAAGSQPIYYQWMIDGTPVAGATNATYTFPALCGVHTVQVAFTNSQSGGIPVTSSQAQLQGDPSPTNLTFNADGTGWQLNTAGVGNVPSFVGDNVLELTDGTGGEASSAFYSLAQFVGEFTASFTYTPNGSADGTCFVVQNSPGGDAALGAGGGGLGYYGITNSIALEINLYDIPGIAQGTNGGTYGDGGGQVYLATPPVSVAYGDPIHVQLNWAHGVLAINLTDTVSLNTYSTNYTYGPLTPILGGSNLGYVGFTGGDGGLTSVQTVSNFQFSSVIPPVSLSLSPVTTNTFVISWSATDPSYQLQTTTSLTAPAWVAGPTPVLVNGVNKATVTVTGSAQQYYRLVRVVTCN